MDSAAESFLPKAVILVASTFRFWRLGGRISATVWPQPCTMEMEPTGHKRLFAFLPSNMAVDQVRVLGPISLHTAVPHSSSLLEATRKESETCGV